MNTDFNKLCEKGNEFCSMVKSKMDPYLATSKESAKKYATIGLDKVISGCQMMKNKIAREEEDKSNNGRWVSIMILVVVVFAAVMNGEFLLNIGNNIYGYLQKNVNKVLTVAATSYLASMDSTTDSDSVEVKPLNENMDKIKTIEIDEPTN